MAPVTGARGASGDRPARVSVEVGAVLALARVKHVGPAGIRTLIDRLGGGLAALGAASTAGELTDRQRARVEASLDGHDPETVAEAAAGEAAADLRPGDRVLAYGQPGYPERLERLHFPPPLLWARGPLPVDAPRTVAIVGTRSATRPARDLAREIARELAEAGVRVVSGLASGIDGNAHRGALDGGGETAGVLGSGLRFRYPRENHDLYARLEGGGLLLTEFAPSVRPVGHNFPRRNRIVAGLADAVLVVQAGRRSGALLTAAEAGEIGVEVCACPGDPHLPGSVGCHDLLRDGAGLVTEARDVLRLLGWAGDETALARPDSPFDPEPDAVVDDAVRSLIERLERQPAALDELAEAAGGIREATVLLARLELAGVVRGLPGGRFARVRSRRRGRE